MRSPSAGPGRSASLGRGITTLRQPATGTRTASAAALATYGRPRVNVTVTGGSCSTHVPPIVNVLHPGSGHTESIVPRDRIQSGSDSFCIGV